MSSAERKALKIAEASRGLCYWGQVSQVISPTQFACANLAAMGDGFFKDYLAVVQRKFDGTLTDPKSEQRIISAYTSAGGLFSHAAFRTTLAVGDEVVFFLYPILNNIQTIRPLNSLFEGWQFEEGIDESTWVISNPATGGAWNRGAVGAYLMAVSSPNAGESARLRSKERWVCAPLVYGPDQIIRILCLEFEVCLQGLGNIDEVTFFLGLSANAAAVRTVNNIIGFGLTAAGALETITDDAGVETTNTGFGETMATTFHKLKIDISLNSVVFSLDENVIATHITNLPNAPMYLNFYYPTNMGGASIISLGTIRAWTEDIAR